jgi:hypothetical protein
VLPGVTVAAMRTATGRVRTTVTNETGDYTLGVLCVGPRAGPMAEGRAQLVRLLVQLPHALHLHGHVATDFLDLALEGIRQCRASGRSSIPTRAA